MSTPFIIPFNFQPVTTVVATTASYTVPAGKYSRVVIDMDCSAWITSATQSTGTGGTAVGGSPGNSSKTKELWLKAGDVLTNSTTNASGSVISAASGAAGGVGTSTATFTLNSTVIATCKASATAAVFAGSIAGSVTFSGIATVSYTASEYNVIS
jgi:hypothetical protein